MMCKLYLYIICIYIVVIAFYYIQRLCVCVCFANSDSLSNFASLQSEAQLGTVGIHMAIPVLMTTTSNQKSYATRLAPQGPAPNGCNQQARAQQEQFLTCLTNQRTSLKASRSWIGKRKLKARMVGQNHLFDFNAVL